MPNLVDRVHFLDPMRSVLMMLGVVIHASNLYTTDADWLISANETSVVADYIIIIIHSFRMPAFFMISGYFCVLTLRKYNIKRFLLIRSQRILIPLVATAVILNSIQSLLLSSAGIATITVESYFFSGGWVSHLWFLVNLIVYFLVSVVVYGALNERVIRWLRIMLGYIGRMPVFVVLLSLPLLSIGVLVSNNFGFPLYSELFGFINFLMLADYAPYYAFGVLLAVDTRLWSRFLSSNIFTVLLLIVFGLLLIIASDARDSVQWYICYLYGSKLVSWCAASLCFHLFYRYLNNPSVSWQFWSDASYTVYLFHHLLVISLGLILIQSPLPVLVNLVVLIAITLYITYQIHSRIVLRYSWARWLFNGKTLTRMNLASSTN